MVGIWNCEVGQGVGGAVGCEYGYRELDGGAVGELCGLIERCCWVEVRGGSGWVYNDHRIEGRFKSYQERA